MTAIFLNGERRSIPADLTVTAMLAHLNLEPRLVALEYNGEILHRQHWATTVVDEGDRIEIVTIVGGG
ncbi:MAG: sulfur carrier protein ThiS [Cyanobacteria bacterium P01_D01_bin.123]